jgi:hypothetical protein
MVGTVTLPEVELSVELPVEPEPVPLPEVPLLEPLFKLPKSKPKISSN